MEPEANFFTEELCNPQPLQTEVLLRWWLLYLLLSLTDLFVLTWSKKGNEKKITRDQDLKEPAVGPGKVKNLREGVHKEWLVQASLPEGWTRDTPSSAEEILNRLQLQCMLLCRVL